MNPASHDPAKDRQLEEILHAYLQAVDAGQAPDRDALLRQHLDCATELTQAYSTQITLDPSGKIILAGDAVTTSNSNLPYEVSAIVRFNPDGTLDTSFNGSGTLTLAANGGNGFYTSIAILSYGKILVAADSNTPDGNPVLVVTGLNSDGSLDTSFGSNGSTSVPDDTSVHAFQTSIAQQTDQSFLVESSGGLFQFNSDGSVGSTFGTNGLVDQGGETGISPAGLAVLGNGEVLVGGTIDSLSNTSTFGLSEFQSNGALDPAFGTNNDGVVDSPAYLTYAASASGLAVESDGSILVDGAINSTAYPSYLLDSISNGQHRLQSPDPTFGPFEFATSNVTLQDNGQIVVVGGFSQPQRNFEGVIRINPNGTPDYAFNTNSAISFQSVFPLSYEVMECMSAAIQPNGDIIVAGVSGTPGQEIALVRLNPDGTLDRTFGTDGLVQSSVGRTSLDVSVVIQTDGDIVVSGALGSTPVVLRYNPDGSLDSSFATGGIVQLPYDGSLDSGGSHLVLQSNGLIVLADPGAIFRLNSGNGSLDSTFGQGGVVYPALDQVNDAILGDDGRIILAGSVFNSTTGSDEFGLERLNSTDGSPDASFGTAGVVTADVGTTYARFSTIALQNGQIIASGITSNGPGNSQIVLARYQEYNPATTLVVSTASTTISGQAQDITVTAEDAFGNVVATLAVRSSSPAATQLQLSPITHVLCRRRRFAHLYSRCYLD